jgi:hypothetical protein
MWIPSDSTEVAEVLSATGLRGPRWRFVPSSSNRGASAAVQIGRAESSRLAKAEPIEPIGKRWQAHEWRSVISECPRNGRKTRE